jgi:hypothetical protein
VFIYRPRLAGMIGDAEALFLGQLSYWLLVNEERVAAGTINREFVYHLDEGGVERVWFYQTLEGWHRQFPGWSLSKVRRVSARLKARGLIEVDNFNRHAYDRTLWYTIRREAYDNLIGPYQPDGETVMEVPHDSHAEGDRVIHTCVDNFVENPEGQDVIDNPLFKVNTSICSPWTNASVQGEQMDLSTMNGPIQESKGRDLREETKGERVDARPAGTREPPPPGPASRARGPRQAGGVGAWQVRGGPVWVSGQDPKGHRRRGRRSFARAGSTSTSAGSTPWNSWRT